MTETTNPWGWKAFKAAASEFKSELNEAAQEPAHEAAQEPVDRGLGYKILAGIGLFWAGMNAPGGGGYNNGWTYQPLPQPQYQPRDDRAYFPQYNQQPSYIQAQPWFQQPYYAAQIPPQWREATNQYANPFAGPFTPYQVSQSWQVF